MKNIANNQGKFQESRRIFSLHVRYLSLTSLLLVLLLVAFGGQIRVRTRAAQTSSHRDRAFSELLYAAFTDASDSLRAASESRDALYCRDLRVAGEAVERIRGGCDLYSDLRSRRLRPYLEQLATDCAELSDRAALGIVTDADHARCLQLAGQIDRLTEGDGRLLDINAGGMLDLRISPFLEAGWERR